MTGDLSPNERKAITAISLVIAEAIESLGEVPSGELYACVSPYINIHVYTSVIAVLVSAGYVEERSHVLIWKGKKA